MFRRSNKAPIDQNLSPDESDTIRRDHVPKSKMSEIASLLRVFLIVIIVLFSFLVFFGSDLLQIAKPTDQSPNISKKTAVVALTNNLVMNQDTNKSKLTYIDGPCYQVTIPFELGKISDKGRCSVYTSIRNIPLSNFTVDYKLSAGADTSDLLMRRSKPDKYIQSTIVAGENKFIVFHNKEYSGYEKTAFFQNKVATIAITLQLSSSGDYNSEFTRILASFHCIDECKFDTL